MPGDFPDQLSDVPCTVRDFNSDDIIASGHMDLQFVPHTDRLRTMRVKFRGDFRPAGPEHQAALESALIAGFATGAAAQKIEVEHGERTWVLVVKLVVGDDGFTFTGRNDPKPAL